MTRKQFFALLAGGGIAQARPYLGGTPATEAEHQFAQKFTLWATLGNHNGDIVDVKEIRAWRETTHAWTKLKNLVEQSYK